MFIIYTHGKGMTVGRSKAIRIQNKVYTKIKLLNLSNWYNLIYKTIAHQPIGQRVKKNTTKKLNSKPNLQ